MHVDLTRVRDVELGVGIGRGDELIVRSVPIDDGVGDALVAMVAKTTQTMDALDGESQMFNPSEKLAATEYLTLANEEADCAVAFRCFHVGVLIPLEDIRHNLSSLRFYFVRIVDRDGSKLMGVKSASVFKRIGSRHKLLTVIDNSMTLFDSPVFQLDDEFDFLIEEDQIHILRPKQFVLVCEMQEALRIAAPANVAAINRQPEIFDLSSVADAAQQKSRVASLVASINNLNLMEGLNFEKFRQRCSSVGVRFSERDGRLVVEEPDIVKFLEVLDRRRYGTDLTDGESEEWLATSRNRA